MSMLNFALEAERVTILTDTKATREGGGRHAHLFCAKVFPAPHLQMVFAGTGLAQLIHHMAWFGMTESVAQDIDEIDQQAPKLLRAIWARYGFSPADPNEAQRLSTAYHFGWSPRAARMVGFAYGSTNDFESERLPDMLGIKPAVPWVAPGQDLGLGGFDGLLDLAHRQKAWHDEQPEETAVHCGGELISYFLSRGPNGTLIDIATWGRFADYQADLASVRGL